MRCGGGTSSGILRRCSAPSQVRLDVVGCILERGRLGELAGRSREQVEVVLAAAARAVGLKHDHVAGGADRGVAIVAGAVKAGEGDERIGDQVVEEDIVAAGTGGYDVF